MKSLLTHPVSLAFQYYAAMLGNYFFILSGISFTYNPSAALQSNLESIAFLGLAPFFAATWVGLLNAFVKPVPLAQKRLFLFALAMAIPILAVAFVFWIRAHSNTEFQAVLAAAIAGYGVLVFTSLLVMPTLIAVLKKTLWPKNKH